MSEQLDKRISTILFAVSGAIVLYGLVKGLIWFYEWFINLPAYSAGWWGALGHFCLDNLSIIIVIYLVICLQVAGVAEFRFRKNFLKAFLLGIVLTPPGMIFIWGRK
ncbi:MAG: hypothetical protein JXR87_08725 [Candidatus Marinimicrobia bacterium]|nr:hypothetical protein [Candidatus Neomarinimicrobiota bacterium]